MSLRGGVFFASAAATAWVLVGYPLSLAIGRARPWRKGTRTPMISLIIPALHERETLPLKLSALSSLDYPAERLQVVVAIDDDAELLRRAHRVFPAATFLFSAERGGKAKALNRALAAATGDVVVVTDANNVLERSSLRAAVRHFEDPQISAVAGRRGEVGSAYDRYEDVLRRLESRTGSVAAASGEFVAIRRSRLPEWPTAVVNDDFWLLCELVRSGGRVVYDPAAASIEPGLAPAAEVARRSRIAAGRAMLLSELRGLPWRFRMRLISHKYGRLAIPFLLVAGFTSSLSLARQERYRRLVAWQAGAYSLGVLGAAGFAPRGRAGAVMRAAGQFMVGNWAVAVGVVRALRGQQGVRWQPIERPP